MIRRPPRSTRTDTLFPYTTLFRSLDATGGVEHASEEGAGPFQQAILHRRAEQSLQAGAQDGFLGDDPTGQLAGKAVGHLRRRRLGEGETEDPGGRAAAQQRSEERRVGTECVSPCRSRWSTYH